MTKRLYQDPVPQPCNDCPFRRKSLAGWLGAAAPESFVENIQREYYLPCHQTMDYADSRWKQKWEAGKTGKGCAGALIMSTNMCKSPRDPTFPRMGGNRVDVFDTPQQFVDHHRRSKTQSWNMDTEDE